MSWLDSLGPEFGLSAAQIGHLDELISILAGEERLNVTAVREPESILDVHIRDSLSLLAMPEFSHAVSAIDIGSGGGLPGLPLAIARPQIRFTLLESVRKKADFIDAAAAALGLENVRSLPWRAEDAGRSELRESFDLAFARAVAALPVVLEYAFPLLVVGGSALLQRGGRDTGDEEAAVRASSLLGGELNRIAPVEPYAGSRNLHVWVFKKVSPTDLRYPRRAGVPARRPLSG